MESYYGTILWNYITESCLWNGSRGCPGRPRSPLGSRGSLGHAPGTAGDAPGTPGHAPGDGVEQPQHRHLRSLEAPYINRRTLYMCTYERSSKLIVLKKWKSASHSMDCFGHHIWLGVFAYVIIVCLCYVFVFFVQVLCFSCLSVICVVFSQCYVYAVICVVCGL